MSLPSWSSVPGSESVNRAPFRRYPRDRKGVLHPTVLGATILIFCVDMWIKSTLNYTHSKAEVRHIVWERNLPKIHPPAAAGALCVQSLLSQYSVQLGGFQTSFVYARTHHRPPPRRLHPLRTAPSVAHYQSACEICRATNPRHDVRRRRWRRTKYVCASVHLWSSVKCAGFHPP